MGDLDPSERPSLGDAVRADLDRWGLAGTSLAAATLDIVDRLTDPELKPAAAALLHQRLDTYLAHLRKLAPPEVTSDVIDEVARQREERRKAVGMA